MMKLIPALFLILLSCISKAQTIIPDSTFGNDGIVTNPVGVHDDKIWSLVLQPDGKIVAAGLSYNGTVMNYAIARYLTDGTLDTAFSNDGYRTDSAGATSCSFHSVAVQNDGKIVAAGFGRFGGQDDFVIYRYTDNGNLDSTFGINGRVNTDFFNLHDDAFAVLIQPDGKIVAAGVSGNLQLTSDFGLARYNTDGSLDTTFSNDGKLNFNYGGGVTFGYAAALQSDGKIVISGFTNSTNAHDMALARVNTDGSLDSTFGNNGLVSTSTASALQDEQLYAVAIQPDGKIVTAGYSIVTAPYSKFAVLRYLANGTLDSTFNNDGIAITSFNIYNDQVRSVIVQQDGRILAGGFSNSGLQNDFALACYLTDGSPDTTFGTGGQLITPVSADYDVIYSLKQQSDGKILAGGFAQSGSDYLFAVVRYVTDLNLGILDFSNENNSLIIYPNPIAENATLKYSLQRDEIISIAVYDLQGRKVKEIINEDHQNSGEQTISISLVQNLKPGEYLIRITTSKGMNSLKIVKE